MKDKIAREILKIEKDRLMSKPESDRDWELITALDTAIDALDIDVRPQGEWIIKNLVDPYGKCNQCGEICEVDNFCSNCGADMRRVKK